jgi:hypothetical protein
MLDWGHWSKSGGVINARELGLKGTMNELCKLIQENGKKRKLQKVVGRVWKRIEKECELDLAPEYQ